MSLDPGAFADDLLTVSRCSILTCTAVVDVLMVSGSTARGDADLWSDAEVGVFWSRPLTTSERAVAAEAETRWPVLDRLARFGP